MINGTSNGNGANGVQWKTIASALAFLVTGAFGWLFYTVISLSAVAADNTRSIDNIWKWIQAMQTEDSRWKAEEHQLDVKVQEQFERRDQNLNDALRRMNDRINAVAIAKGLTPPP